ncbi:homoserine kinase [Bacteroidetes bacterium endosymbiont of Geopemphigus sp.]|uniref:homoserine kinase n=1 Tax=Bacteroidetes bacterium endosymbiont of Geopemphigus sp. TaxID=2047937 RepID=UPI000CD069FD|nr:homoserine kinase [Bacteroidetes bacterium endosymbiont of Geopemphigus sp.]
MKKGVKIFAPATIANVSCGFDVIGLALEEPGDEIILRKSQRMGVYIHKIHGADLSRDPDLNVAGVALKNFLRQLPNCKEGLEVEIFKNIQPGSGIGSSAASAAGAVVGANVLFGEPFTPIELVRFAMEGERLASGSAHADNVAPAIMGGFTLVRSYLPLDIIALHTPEELWATVLHPKIEIKTSEAREILKKKVLMNDAIRQWGNVGALVAGLYLEDYSLISRSLEDFIVEPIRSILIPAFQELKIECKASGALGGGISGSGPSVFMLSKGKEKARIIASRMDKIYAKLGVDYKIYLSPVNRQGVKWEFIN